MKKRKLKKLLKKALKKISKVERPRSTSSCFGRSRLAFRKPTDTEISLMHKVKKQLDDLRKPVAIEESTRMSDHEMEVIEYALMRGTPPEKEISIFEYVFMDQTLCMMQVHHKLCS
jgi:hypothetical protein